MRRQETSQPPEGCSSSPTHEFETLLRRHLAGVAELSSRQIAVLEEHYSVLERWNKVVNLSSIRDLETVVVRHYCESVFLAVHLPAGAFKIVDAGSGAGFPGVPIAVVRPDCEITLAESHSRKAVFLKEATRDLTNVVVRADRAQSLEERFELLVSRAVSWRDLAPIATRLADGVALLVGDADAARITECGEVSWQEPIIVPWGLRRKLLIGRVSRGTC